MTRIVLELPHDNDLNLLLALLERFGIRVVEKGSLKKQVKNAETDEAFVLKGLPSRPDFAQFMADFDASRADIVLPGREN